MDKKIRKEKQKIKEAEKMVRNIKLVSAVPKYVHCVYIPANLSKPESGTKSLKKWDFWPESGTLLRNLAKIAKITKFVRKKVHKRSHKNRDKPFFKQRKSRTVHQK